MPVNVAVIGVGNMGALHCRVYSELKDAKLVAVSDLDKELLASVASKYDAKPYLSFEEMFARENIDAVSIVVPTKYHYSVAKKAIEHGKHVLIEKPITETEEQAKELIKLAKEKNVKLMVGHLERFNPAIQFIKNLIQKNALGQTLIISTKRVGHGEGATGKYGDITLDIALHDIDIMRFLTGQEIVKVYCDKTKTPESSVLDNAFATFKLSNGTLGILETNWVTQRKMRKLTITAEQATVDVDYITQDIEIHKKPPKAFTLDGFETYLSEYAEEIIEKPTIVRKEPLKEELNHFIDCVQNNKEPLVSGEDGLKALRVALACNESIKSGQPVVIG